MKTDLNKTLRKPRNHRDDVDDVDDRDKSIMLKKGVRIKKSNVLFQ
ncbi:hypothetical protein PP707_08450 [Acetobacter pasteurianus]|nr:hypothetical protein [Acetobacter pasteurianus]